jgi:Cu/Zn superoxide dismutase
VGPIAHLRLSPCREMGTRPCDHSSAVEAAETAKAILKDAKDEIVRSVSLTQTSAGALLQLSLKGVPAGEHAFHVHAVGKCEPPLILLEATLFRTRQSLACEKKEWGGPSLPNSS